MYYALDAIHYYYYYIYLSNLYDAQIGDERSIKKKVTYEWLVYNIFILLMRFCTFDTAACF